MHPLAKRSEWKKLLAFLAVAELERLNGLRQQSQQCKGDVAHPSVRSLVSRTTYDAQEKFQSQMLDKAQFMCAIDVGVACIQHAFRSKRMEPTPIEQRLPDQRCCFTNLPADPDLTRTLLDAEHQRVTVYVSSETLVQWVESMLVAGNALRWIADKVADWLHRYWADKTEIAFEQQQMTLASLDMLQDHMETSHKAMLAAYIFFKSEQLE
jgi:hypothetical protein